MATRKILFPRYRAIRVGHISLQDFSRWRRREITRVWRGGADWDRLRQIGGEIDLAAVENGGLVLVMQRHVLWSRHNLIMPGRGC